MRAARLLSLFAAILGAGCGGEATPPTVAKAPSAPVTARPAGPPAAQPIVLPAELVANRFFVTGTLQDGKTIRFFTDSGGGSQFLYDETVQRFGFPVSVVKDEEGEDMKITPIPAWREGASIPPPLAINQPTILQTSYIVLPRRPGPQPGGDGFLGQGWFGGRVWTFDYPGKRLLWRAGGDVPPHAPTEEVPLHFPLDKDGQPTMHFGRMTITVDGEPLDLLFDTGATVALSPEALDILHDGGPAMRATSFITMSVFDRWHTKHPDWRVIEKADQPTGFANIEVPKILVAGQEVGPVWFTSRPDGAFHKFMASMMDASVEGALGGSALGYFTVTVDYPGRKAIFQKAR